MTEATSGPPTALTAASLSMPSSTASRRWRFPTAALLFGLRRLNTMYGWVLEPPQIWNDGFFDAISDEIDAGLTGVSPLVRFMLPASMSASCVDAEDPLIVSTILFTYWCRIVSVDCFHAGFFTKLTDLPGWYELSAYGPSEIRCWSSWRLAGR